MSPERLRIAYRNHGGGELLEVNQKPRKPRPRVSNPAPVAAANALSMSYGFRVQNPDFKLEWCLGGNFVEEACSAHCLRCRLDRQPGKLAPRPPLKPGGPR
jgi:hypothetical protein